MSRFRVEPHERYAEKNPILKRMAKLVLSVSREPQVLDLPQNANFMFAESEGWKLGLWFEIRPPYNTNVPVIYQLFTDGLEVPSYAVWKATILREQIGDLRSATAYTAYHLFEFPRGSRLFDTQSGLVQSP